MPLAIYLVPTLYCYSWIPDDKGRTWIRLQELIRIPPVYYLGFLLAWTLAFGFLAAERKIKGPNTDTFSPGRSAVYLFGALLVFAIQIGISVMAEYLDWKLDLIILMVIFVIIFILGSSVAVMFIKQAVPYKLHHAVDTDQSEAAIDGDVIKTNGHLNADGNMRNGGMKEKLPLESMQANGKPLGHDNVAYSE